MNFDDLPTNTALVAELHRVAEVLATLPDLPPLVVRTSATHGPGQIDLDVQLYGGAATDVLVAAVDGIAVAFGLPPADRQPVADWTMYGSTMYGSDGQAVKVWTALHEPTVELEPAR